MPYIKFLNEYKRDCGIPPIDMAGMEFRVAPARVPGALYTFVNANLVKSQPTQRAGTAMYIGVFDEVDSPKPFTVVRLTNTRYLRPADSMGITPGSLTLDMTACGQGSEDYTKEPLKRGSAS